MEPLSKIAKLALDEIIMGGFSKLPKLAITGLLNDFQCSWLRRFDNGTSREHIKFIHGHIGIRIGKGARLLKGFS